MKKIVIAVDGYSSCGKSTMAKQLAKQIGYIYVDSGAMYRAVTLFAIQNDLFNSDGSVSEKQLFEKLPEVNISFKLNKETGSPETFLCNENVEQDIRTMAVSSRVSIIAALPFVREKLVDLQQAMGTEKGIIMDGRDIGTTVFPNAEMKVFVTASAEIRAQRRFDELKAKGQPADFDAVLANVKERDYIDSHREVSPLCKADDAIILDNSYLSRQEQLDWLLKKFKEITEK